MAFNAHRGTTGHTIGTSIIGGGGKGGSISPPQPHNLASISTSFGDNGGVSVTHRLKPTGKQDSYDPRLEQTHMFRDAAEAHSHMGALMGLTALRVGSGERKD